MSNADLTRADNDYNSLPMDLISTPETYYIDNQDLRSEKYMLRRSKEIERDLLNQWSMSIDPFKHLGLISCGAYIRVMKFINKNILTEFNNEIGYFIESIKTNNSFKHQIQKIAADYQVDVNDLAKLIIMQAAALFEYDRSYSDAYYAIGALFYSDDEN